VVSIARQLAFGAALALLAADPARAQPDEALARDLFQEGVALAKEERWESALEKFEESVSLVERASTVFNIGTTLVRLNRHKAAIESFERFLELTDLPEQKRAAEDLIARSRESLASIELTIAPPGARLAIDGEVLPSNGPVHEVELDPGERTFEVSAEGFGSIRETIALAPGARVVKSFALEPISAPPDVAVAPSPPPPALAPTVQTGPEDDSIFTSPWLWVVAGAVVVVVAVGIGVGVGVDRTEDPVGGTAMDVIVT
jgi:hypothetical protein